MSKSRPVSLALIGLFVWVTAALLAIALYGCSESTGPEDHWIRVSPSSLVLNEGENVTVTAHTTIALTEGRRIYWGLGGGSSFCVYVHYRLNPKGSRATIYAGESGSGTIEVYTYSPRVSTTLPITVLHVPPDSIYLEADQDSIPVGFPGAHLWGSVFDGDGRRIVRRNLTWFVSDTLIAGLREDRGSACRGSAGAYVSGLKPGVVTVYARSEGVQSNSVSITVEP